MSLDSAIISVKAIPCGWSESNRSFWSKGSHLPDFGVTLSWSIEVVNLDSVFTWCKRIHVDGSRIALATTWLCLNLVEVAVKNHKAIRLWSILIRATCKEKSFWVLDAVDNNILLYSIIECSKSIYLRGTGESFWVSFKFRYCPVISVVSIESFGVKLSPLVKRNPEFSLVSIGETSLSFPLILPIPEITVSRPWTGIFAETPWVSHLNEFVDTFSVGGEADTLEDSVSVTSNKVVVTNCASSSHWVLSFSSIFDNVPEFIISQLIWLMGRYWHTSKSSESCAWNTRVDLSVVDVQLSESFLKKD